MQNQNQTNKMLSTQSQNCEKKCLLKTIIKNPLQQKIYDIACNLPQETDDAYLPIVKIKSDDDLSFIKSVGTYCKAPSMASTDDILNMLDVLSSCLSFGSQHQDKKTALKSYVMFLKDEIYEDFINDTISKIVKSKTFFPSVAEIIETQKVFTERLRKIRLIARKSCLEYIENQEY